MKSGLENHKSDSILEVFRELGLNDVKSREHFQDFANQEALHIRSNREYEPQSTQGNTSEQNQDNYAYLE